MQPIHDRNPAGAWIAFRTDWSTRLADPASSVNMKEEGAHTPGPTQATVEWLIHERDVLGFAAETINTDAGQAWRWPLPYPCHMLMRGAGRYGLQCLTNLDLLPPPASSSSRHLSRSGRGGQPPPHPRALPEPSVKSTGVAHFRSACRRSGRRACGA